jgi:hypothetical protein
LFILIYLALFWLTLFWFAKTPGASNPAASAAMDTLTYLVKIIIFFFTYQKELCIDHDSAKIIEYKEYQRPDDEKERY